MKESGVTSGALLGGYRCLDLTDEKGYACGWILGSLGADVIKIEKPGGDSGRRIGPFYHDIADPEKSLFWFAYNSNKRGITLDLETADGRALFRKLVEKADFVLESFTPGYLADLGLDYPGLSKINPRVILVSITPFGQNGPYSRYKGSDMVVNALGGLLYVYGNPERPPVRTSGIDTVYPVAAADGAIGALVALYEREYIGEGQHVDVSAQESTVTCSFNNVPLWLMSQYITTRQGVYRWLGTHEVRRKQLFPCRDGFISFTVQSGKDGVKSNGGLVEWMASEAMAEPFLLQIDWATFEYDKVTQQFMEQIEESMSRFFMKHTANELYEGALKRKIQICPVNSARDVYENQQLKARGFWTTVEHPELGASITYPGPFVILNDNCCGVRRRAPGIGEHNREVYQQELGLSPEEIVHLMEARAI